MHKSHRRPHRTRNCTHNHNITNTHHPHPPVLPKNHLTILHEQLQRLWSRPERSPAALERHLRRPHHTLHSRAGQHARQRPPHRNGPLNAVRLKDPRQRPLPIRLTRVGNQPSPSPLPETKNPLLNRLNLRRRVQWTVPPSPSSTSAPLTTQRVRAKTHLPTRTTPPLVICQPFVPPPRLPTPSWLRSMGLDTPNPPTPPM